MLRKTLLAVSTLGVILVLFLVYSLSTDSPAESEALPVEAILAQKNLDLPEVSASQPVRERPQLKGVQIGEGGKKAWVTWYDKRTRKAKTRFRATTWEPVSDTEFHLVDLEVQMLTPGGQIVEVQADEGNILVSPGDLSESSIRRGRIWGNVQIRLDRTEPEWREQNPERQEMGLHPEMIVRMWMDELNFDLELSRLETKSEFRVQSEEVDLKGRGLLLRWNEEEDRIDYLEITHGERVELRGLRSSMEFDLLNSEGRVVVEDEEEAADAPDGEQAEPEEEPTAIAQADLATTAQEEDDEVLQIDFSQEEKPRQPVTYEARFTENVVVEQQRGVEMAGQLEADVLTLLFDTGQFKRVAEAGSQDEPTDEEQPAEEHANQSRLVMTWDGPLILEPKGKIEADQESRRFQIEALGEPVHIKDRQGWATCDRLSYHNETGRLWLYGTVQKPVRVQAGPQRSMQTETLFFDRQENIARLSGAGEMRASAGNLTSAQSTPDSNENQEQTIIRWTRSIALTLTKNELTVLDEETGQPKLVRSPYIQRAVLDGDVHLAQAEQQASADQVEIDFLPPDRPGRLISDIGRFEGRDNVRMLNGADDIRCQHLVVEMIATPSGRNVPVSAIASVNVTARQGRRVIEARESLSATMAEIPAPLPVLTDAEVRQLARTRGIDPDAMEPGAWERRRDEWLARRAQQTETAIVSVQASGQVRVDDPERNLRVRADELDCTFPDGKNIEEATVVSRSGRTSAVRMDDFAIAGERIEVDASRPWALVPGPGEVEFYSDQDLDGRKLDEPLPVAVSWNGRMEMRGQRNRLHFEQDVRATSTDQGRDHYTLDCDGLTVSFVDLPEPVVIQKAAPDPAQYWIFEPLVRAIRRDRADSSGLVGDDDSNRTFRKQPVFMLADGNARAVYSGYEPTTNALLSRMRVAGPRIAVDLRQQSTNVDGAGNLLIENYQLPTQRDRRRASAAQQSGSMLANWASGGPSQTLFTWENSMSFLTRRNVAIFDKKVHMNHRAGAEMAMIKNIAAARDLDMTHLQQLKGRRTTLDCDYLLVQFMRSETDTGEGSMSGVRSADLRLIEATGPVTLVDGNKTLVGHELVYVRDSGLVTVRAQVGREANIYDEDGESGALRAHWRGPLLRWNLSTNRIEASKSTILLGGR